MKGYECLMNYIDSHLPRKLKETRRISCHGCLAKYGHSLFNDSLPHIINHPNRLQRAHLYWLVENFPTNATGRDRVAAFHADVKYSV